MSVALQYATRYDQYVVQPGYEEYEEVSDCVQKYSKSHGQIVAAGPRDRISVHTEGGRRYTRVPILLSKLDSIRCFLRNMRDELGDATDLVMATDVWYLTVVSDKRPKSHGRKLRRRVINSRTKPFWQIARVFLALMGLYYVLSAAYESRYHRHSPP